MPTTPVAVTRSWSMGVVFVILGLIFLGVLPSEPGRAVASILCLALLVHSWLAQRRHVQTRQLLFLTLLLSLPALASLWLGLNVIRFYSYAPESSAPVYWAMVRSQNVIEWCARALVVAVTLWTVAALGRWLAKSISA